MPTTRQLNAYLGTILDTHEIALSVGEDTVDPDKRLTLARLLAFVSETVNADLVAWTVADSYRYVGAPTYGTGANAGVIVGATIVWPDSSGGVLAVSVVDPVWLVWTSYTITHVASGKTVTVTGLVMDSDGEITTPYSYSIS